MAGTLVEGKSYDNIEERIEELKRLFPEAVVEGRLDEDVLRTLLGDEFDNEHEKYRFEWKGKQESLKLAQRRSSATLRPDFAASKDWETTENLYIEGDNLEVMKLLQRAYLRQVKMIYIDPPYNTGNDFVYHDDFKDPVANYKELTGQTLRANPETTGRYHSNWLNMMYPRLLIARSLLRDDGVIFISIDDHEVHNLRKLCDEVFGEENFIANFLWKKKSTTSNVKDAQISSQVDYQLCYGRSILSRIKQRIKTAADRSYPHQDVEGSYRTAVIEKKDSGTYKRETMRYKILGHPPREGKRWQIGADTAAALAAKNRFLWDGEKILLKVYDFEDNASYSAQPNLLDDHGTSESGAKAANIELFNVPEIFDNPKPVELLKHLLAIVTSDDDLILDFFSGSATTAHAVIQLNAEDGGKRRFIMVQLPEKTDEQSEAYKAGYKTIADIGRERIR
ncbi:site-specific DNA-methyltransferase, partial [Bartonella rattaustraliani]|uniref:site-specific DNA-methyltransferase n=1 Tax=Bartonella rattaustraliani TaxID=481139 RepID=UPI00037927A2